MSIKSSLLQSRQETRDFGMTPRGMRLPNIQIEPLPTGNLFLFEASYFYRGPAGLKNGFSYSGRDRGLVLLPTVPCDCIGGSEMPQSQPAEIPSAG
jgi:hypothetical protein